MEHFARHLETLNQTRDSLLKILKRRNQIFGMTSCIRRFPDYFVITVKVKCHLSGLN